MNDVFRVVACGLSMCNARYVTCLEPEEDYVEAVRADEPKVIAFGYPDVRAPEEDGAEAHRAKGDDDAAATEAVNDGIISIPGRKTLFMLVIRDVLGPSVEERPSRDLASFRFLPDDLLWLCGADKWQRCA